MGEWFLDFWIPFLIVVVGYIAGCWIREWISEWKDSADED